MYRWLPDLRSSELATPDGCGVFMSHCRGRSWFPRGGRESLPDTAPTPERHNAPRSTTIRPRDWPIWSVGLSNNAGNRRKGKCGQPPGAELQAKKE